MTGTIDYRSMPTEQLKKRRDALVYADDECGWTADQEMARVLELEALDAALVAAAASSTRAVALTSSDEGSSRSPADPFASSAVHTRRTRPGR